MDGGIKTLANYRYERALEELDNAKELLETKHYRLALNRSYYAIFYGMRAVNVLDGFDSSKHSGVIAHFNQFYVKTGVFTKEISKIIQYSSELRELADYKDFFVASSHDAEEQVNRADSFLKCIKEYLERLELI